VVNGINNNLAGTAAAPLSPKLFPLNSNGGFTQTQALINYSPATNLDSNPNSLYFDQRGLGFFAL
jgi:hypothetical protein